MEFERNEEKRREQYAALEDRISEVLSRIPRNAFKDLRALIKEMKNYPSDDAIKDYETPITKQWEIVYANMPGAHSWQLIRLPNGNYVWDTTGDISDVTLQVYKNGWIIKAFSATNIVATYSPTAVRLIEKYSNVIHEMLRAYREHYNRLIIRCAESGGLEAVYVEICKAAVEMAKQNETEPVTELMLQASRRDKNEWEVLDELDRVFPYVDCNDNGVLVLDELDKIGSDGDK